MNDDFIRILTENGIGIAEAKKMNAYADVLVKENKKYNLTSITDYSQMAYLHFLDSVNQLENIINLDEDQALIDIGTGGGFPAVPIAILYPELKITALDATEKKVRFVRDACEMLQIHNVRAICGRAELISKMESYQMNFDVLVSRAVASLSVILEIGYRFLKKGGKAVVYKGPGYSEELNRATKAIETLGFCLRDVVKSEVNGAEHFLLVLEREKDAPERYPRHYSKIVKQPL